MRLHPPCLGNFLSGMETFQAVASNGFPVAALETSLVEWKRRGGTIMNGYNKALETSLVEWKLENALSGATADMRLGNFLSGMETRCEVQHRRERDLLGNFLSGMETFLQSGQFIPTVPLGNFLSGMETSVRPFYHDHPVVPWKLP